MAYPTIAEVTTRLRVDATDPSIPGIAAAAQSYIDGARFYGLPEALRNEAYYRFIGYLYDSPSAATGTSFANAWRNCGAEALVGRYRVRDAGVIDEPGASATGDGGGVSALIDARIKSALAEADYDAKIAAIAAKQMPPNQDEAAGGTSTTIRGWTSALIRIAINAVVNAALPAWARTGNTDPIPAAKLANAPNEVANEDIVPFAETFRDEYTRTFEATFNANNADTAAISNDNTVPDGAPAGTSDFLLMTEPPAAKVGDWFRAERGDKYIIAKIQFVKVNVSNQTEFWFNPSTDIADTLKFDSLGTGSGTIRFAKRAVQRDGSNVTTELVEEIQGTNEAKTFTGYTRVAASGILSGTGEYSWSGSDGDTMLLWPKAGERAEIIRRIKYGHFISLGGHVEIEVTTHPTVFNNTWLTFHAKKFDGTLPAVNESDVLQTLGDDVHRSEMSRAALKATLPPGGKFLKVKADGSDVEGVDAPTPTLNDGDVTTAKIANLAVTLGKLAAAVTARLLPTGVATGKFLKKTATGWEGADPGGDWTTVIDRSSAGGEALSSAEHTAWLAANQVRISMKTVRGRLCGIFPGPAFQGVTAATDLSTNTDSNANNIIYSFCEINSSEYYVVVSNKSNAGVAWFGPSSSTALKVEIR